MGKVFVGHDWAEAHHDVFVEDDTGDGWAQCVSPRASRGCDAFTSCWQALPRSPAR
jgi:hypothetical protein